MTEQLRLLITVEGGLVQSVSSNIPIDATYVILDYDTEGADPEDIVAVPQGEGLTVDALMSGLLTVDNTNRNITEFLDKETP